MARHLQNDDILRAMAGAGVLCRTEPLLPTKPHAVVASSGTGPSFASPRITRSAPSGNPYLSRPSGVVYDTASYLELSSRPRVSPSAPLLLSRGPNRGREEPQTQLGAVAVAEAAAAGLRVTAAPPWQGGPCKTAARDSSPRRDGTALSLTEDLEEGTALLSAMPGPGWRQQGREAHPLHLSGESPVSPGGEAQGLKTLNAIVTHGNDLVLDRARALSESILQRHERINSMLAKRNAGSQQHRRV